MKWLGFAWSSMALALGLLVATPDDLLAQGRGRPGGGGGGARPSMGRVGGGGAHPMGGGMSRPAPQMSHPSGGNIRPPVQMPQSRPSFGNAARPSMPSGGMGSPMARPAPGNVGGRPSTLPGNIGGSNRLPGGATTRPAPGGMPGLGGNPMTRPAPGGIPNLGGNSLSRPPQGGIGGNPTTRPAPQLPQNRPTPGATRPNLGNTQRPSLQPGSVRPTTRPAPGDLGGGIGGGNRPGVGGGIRPPGPGGGNLPNGGANLPNGGNRPGQGDRPGGGNRPGIGDRPSIGNLTKPAPGFERPVPGGGNRPTTLPGDLNRPGQGGGNRPGIGGGGNRPGIGGGGNRPDLSRPGVNDLPGIGGNRPNWNGNRPGIGGNRPDWNGNRPDWNGNRPTTLPGTVNRPGIGGNRPDWNGNRPDWNGNRPGGWGGNGWGGGNRPGGIGNNNNIINNTNNNFNNININQWNRPAWDRPYNRPGWGYGNNWGWNNNWNNSWHDSWHNNCINQHYHGWYNGCWNGYWGSSWYAPLAYGAVGWGLNSFFTGGVGYGYGATYVNPYYTVPATTVAVPTAQVAPYDYSQPVIVNNYVTTENTSQGSQADSSATGGASTATQTQENPAFKKFDDGLALFKTGRYPDSLGSFNSALKDMPGDPVIHEVRALTLFAIGDYGQAAAALNSLLASAPGMDWTTLSGLYGNVDDYTNQLRKLESHCKANPKDPAAHFVLAYHYLVIGSKDSAINALKVVVANQPQDVTAKRMLDALSPPEPKEDSATQARSAEPVAAEADSKPAEDDGKPEPETDLVGTWVATAGKSTIELSITEDSKFTWKATEADKVVAELDGDLVAAGDAISLDTSDKGSMAGSVVSGGADQWTFIPPGAPAEAGLKFNRKK